jgi:predicted AAA+ superfamily ATPase
MDMIPRQLLPHARTALDESRVVCIIGPRQAGKSTLVGQLIQTGYRADYVTLDDPATLDAARSDPTGFVSGRRALAIDEVQRSPELLLAIKRIVDADQSRGQFLLTGSANLLMGSRIADALPGRVDYLTLWPFSQQELTGRHRDLLSRWFGADRLDLAWRTDTVGRPDYANRVLQGGFPEAVDVSSARRIRFFSGYVDSILSRGVSDVATVRNPSDVGRVLRLLAARSGSLANWTSLARDLQLDPKTVAMYGRILEELFLVTPLPSWHANLGHRVVKSPKLHISDTGLLCAVVGADANRLVTDDGFAGAALETFVVNELQRLTAVSELAPLLRLHHYRDQRGVEVDLVIEHADGRVLACEVKSSATPRARDMAGLRFLQEQLGDRFLAGILVHLGPETVRFGERLHAVPLDALFG